MKTYHQFVEEYKSINQRDQETRQSFKDNLPDDELFRRMTYDEMIRRLKRIYEVEKREEIMKGLLSNPTHLDLIRNVPLKGPTPKPSSRDKTSSFRKNNTITKKE